MNGASKKTILMIFWGSLFVLFLGTQNVLAFSFDFSGTVLYDSRSIGSAYGDSFEGEFSSENESLFLKNSDTFSLYNDFGVATGGYFNQDGQDFFYAFSKGPDASSQMGMIWWSNPRTFQVGENLYHNNVYGLAFYMTGELSYTPSQMIAYRLADYFASGYLPTLTGGGSSLDFYSSSCSCDCSSAFLGVIQEPMVSQQSSSAVPLPASVWFLGSGLLFLLRQRKK